MVGAPLRSPGLRRQRQPGPEAKAIHHGADDNASGTTAMMELARRFAQPFQGDRRRIVFMAFSGEESGLLGSEYYCERPLFPLADTAAMVNLDMVGRLRKDDETGKDKILVEGSGTAKSFNPLLDRLSDKYEIVTKRRQASGQGPSDHASFDKKKIPVIFYWTGAHPHYHRPSDTADKINIAGMNKIVDLAEERIPAPGHGAGAAGIRGRLRGRPPACGAAAARGWALCRLMGKGTTR